MRLGCLTNRAWLDKEVTELEPPSLSSNFLFLRQSDPKINHHRLLPKKYLANDGDLETGRVASGRYRHTERGKS